MWSFVKTDQNGLDEHLKPIYQVGLFVGVFSIFFRFNNPTHVSEVRYIENGVI